MDEDDLLESPVHPSAMDRRTRLRKHGLVLLVAVTVMRRDSRVASAPRLLAVAFAVALIPLVGASPASGWSPITATETVNVRVAPNLSGGVIGQLSPGLAVPIRCAIAGQYIYDTNVWFYAEFPTGTYGFFSAYYSTADYQTWGDLEDRYGIERCERPTTLSGGSVYYQPRYTLGDPIAPYTTYTATKDFWAPPPWWDPLPDPIEPTSCDTEHAAYWPEYFDGRKITRASGWSLGRLGLTYLLDDHAARANNLREIVLFDPGSLGDYEGACDQRHDQDQLYADWLAADSSRRLLVLAGAVTRDVDTAVVNPAGVTEYHQGIQRYLFPAIRSAGVDDQVLVCNYDTMGHLQVMEQFGWLAGSGPLTTCPGQPDDEWHP
jgi:hypothetical protein